MTRLSTWLSSAALVLGVGLLAAPASAAPAGALTGLQVPAESSNVEQVTYGSRGCWRHRGHWHCPSYGSYYDDDYSYYQPYYGYGPLIGFWHGSGGRHFHGGQRNRGAHFHGGRGSRGHGRR